MIQENSFEHLSAEEQQVALEIVSRIRRRFDGQLVSAILYLYNRPGVIAGRIKAPAMGSFFYILFIIYFFKDGIYQVLHVLFNIIIQDDVYTVFFKEITVVPNITAGYSKLYVFIFFPDLSYKLSDFAVTL